MKIDELVKIYIALRDRRKARKDAFNLDDAQDEAYQEKIEAKLLAHFNETGTDNAGCEYGTAYKTIRVSASVADKELFLKFATKEDNWVFLDARCNKKAAEEYVAANEELPPGVNMSREVVVNVRRS